MYNKFTHMKGSEIFVSHDGRQKLKANAVSSEPDSKGTALIRTKALQVLEAAGVLIIPGIEG